MIVLRENYYMYLVTRVLVIFNDEITVDSRCPVTLIYLSPHGLDNGY